MVPWNASLALFFLALMFAGLRPAPLTASENYLEPRSFLSFWGSEEDEALEWNGGGDELSQDAFMNERYGANVTGGELAVEIRHSHFKRKNVLTERTVKTTMDDPEPSGIDKKNLFSSEISEDGILFRYGLTDWLEVSVKGSVFYRSLSETDDVKPGFGAGFRVTMDDYAFENGTSLFFAVLGNVTSGKFAYDMTDTNGDEFRKEADFLEAEVGVEGRWVIEGLSFYMGCSYMYYAEDSVKTQVLDGADINILEDAMEQQTPAVIWGGMSYSLTNRIDIYAEYHGLNREGPSAGVSLRF